MRDNPRSEVCSVLGMQFSDRDIRQSRPDRFDRAEGNVFVKATEIRPKPIVVLGIWLVFLPMLIGSAAVAIDILSEGSGSGAAGFVFFWIGVGLSVLSLAFLLKVTENYLRKG